MKAIFVVGTAGSGKSLLCSKMHEYYTRNGAFAGVLNLDPGVESLPYTPDIDIRDHIDIIDIMNRYNLGPNGALVMASDMAAYKLDQIQQGIDAMNPDYLIVDTPGQIELFAYRSSGPFLITHMSADAKTGIFLYDGSMVSRATNFLSISLLSMSIRLRLQIPCVNIISKSDLADSIETISKWSEDLSLAIDAAAQENEWEMYTLVSGMVGNIDETEWDQGLIPVSSATGDGLADLEAALSRVLNLGEEVED